MDEIAGSSGTEAVKAFRKVGYELDDQHRELPLKRPRASWTGMNAVCSDGGSAKRSPAEAMGFYQSHVVPHLVNLAMRNRLLAPYRARIVRLAEGRVLEIGIGSALNLPLYTNRATEILGLDPHPKLLRMAYGKEGPVPAKLIEGSAESIPLDDASIDSVVTTWTLCTIPDVVTALAEMRRVLKPHGQLLLAEHGLASEEKVRKWQNRLTPAWKRIAGGCHLNRPIASLIQDAGFHISQMETGYIPGPKPMTFMYEGSALPLPQNSQRS